MRACHAFSMLNSAISHDSLIHNGQFNSYSELNADIEFEFRPAESFRTGRISWILGEDTKVDFLELDNYTLSSGNSH